MKAEWVTTKADGTPITDGRICRLIDPEDGTNPIRVYGKTEQEVFSKIERTMMTAQSTLVHTRQSGANGPQAVPPQAAAPDARILTADQIMELTRDQQIPAKAPQAAARLADHHRALQAQALTKFRNICLGWQAGHPELADSLFNKKLITDNAMLRVRGDASLITAEILEAVYQELAQGGYLVTEEQQPQNPSNPTLPVQADGTPPQVPTRPQAVISTTSHRSARLGSSQVANWKPKYTVAEINKMSTAETEALLNAAHPNHKDYVDSCNYWYPPARQASA